MLQPQRADGTYVELGQQEAEKWRRNGERWREHDPEVAEVHLGYLGILCDDAKICKNEEISIMRAGMRVGRCSRAKLSRGGGQRARPKRMPSDRNSQESEQRVFFDGKSCDELPECVDAVLAFSQVWEVRVRSRRRRSSGRPLTDHLDELWVELSCEDMNRKLSKEGLEEACKIGSASRSGSNGGACEPATACGS